MGHILNNWKINPNINILPSRGVTGVCRGTALGRGIAQGNALGRGISRGSVLHRGGT